MSFADFLKNSTLTSDTDSSTTSSTTSASPTVATVSLTSSESEVSVMSLSESSDNNVSLYSESGWSEDRTHYRWFEDYRDDNYSIVNDEKNIALNSKQINITQEENSQFIPFEMARYYDGIDLMNAIISVHYTRSDGQHASSKAVNVTYNSEKIRFAWLVDGSATGAVGKMKFEIRAEGSITDNKGKTYAYVWKTKTNENLNVLQSLCGTDCGGTISVDESWVQEIVESVATKVAEEIANAQVDEQVQRAENAANAAEQSANNAANSVETVLASKGYATEAYVNQKVASVDVSDQLVSYAKKTEIPTKVSQLSNDAGYLVENNLTDYAKKTDIPTNVSELENDAEYLKTSDAASAYALKSDIEDMATQTFVRDEISKIDVTEQLSNYYTKPEVEEKISSIDVTKQLSDYAKSVDVYTKTEIDNKNETLSSSINTNTTNISSISTTLSNLQNTIDEIDTSPRLTYDVKYNDVEDADVGENVFVLYEIENEGKDNEVKSAKTKFTIVGGSGGGVTSSTLKIEYITKTPYVATVNDKIIIKYSFSGIDSSGDNILEGNYTWKVGNSIVATGIAVSGENSFDISDYISIGTQKVILSITDDAGSLVTKTWTIQKIDVRIESTFNDQLTYPIGTVSFDYTPYGAVSKNVHFILDGEELETVTTTSSGIPMSYVLPSQSHGAHLLESYITTEINSNTIESNHILKDIIWWDNSSELPVISCTQQKIIAKQYDTTNITYTVFDPRTETPTVTLSIDDNIVSTQVLNTNTQVWQFKSADIGEHTLTIKCRDVIKTISLTIEKLDIDVEPITANLVFDFSPTGKTNNDIDRLWSDGTTSMTVSDNFDWTNGGYQLDDNGDQYFCVKAGTTAIINYNLFADDARKNGKEFKIIFKTTNVSKSNATFLTCMSNDSTKTGLQMNVHEAYIRSSLKELYVPYSEEDIIELDFNVIKDTDIPIVMTYEDGTPYRPMSYTSDHTFTQSTPVPITIGSPDCDVHIYRIKAYSASLTNKAILSNFIADARTATEMIARYTRNQIYDENKLLTPESVANACPNMRVIKIEAPHFTNNKKDFVGNTSFECIYKNGDAVLDNWKFENCYHAGQGTTSNEYGAAGRNIDLIAGFDGKHQVTSKIELDPNYVTKLTFGDGSTVTDGSGKIALTRTSVPNNWFNVKVNIASSEMVNNAYLQKRYNDYIPYSTPATRRDSKIKNDMEFVNCVVFIKESDPDLTTHREFQDTSWHFYALGNIGDSKKTDVTRAYDPDDMKEFTIEISDNTLPNSIFQTGVINPDGSMKYPITKSEWVSGNTAYDALYNDWDGSFEFRYDCCGDTKDGSSISTDEEKNKIRTQNKQIWRDFYEFVITSTDDEFKNNLKNWFIVDSATYFYLFTLRYTMIDNRSKNTFWHWAKHYITTEEATTLGDKAAYYTVDDAAAGINNGYRFDFWDYDNDSSLGINNSGELTMTYGKEDTDYRIDGDKSSGYIFNAAESVFFCRIRDLMGYELQKMYVSRESKNCWSASSLINQFDDKQNEWCEELWRVDYVRKYERPYKDGNTRFLEQMMNGKKKYQRRQFERDQEMYMATKFIGNTATSDQIMFRCNTPSSAVVTPDYTLHLTPYSDMYLSVMFGATYRKQIRAKAGVQYDITCPFTTMDDTAVLVYCASRIQSMGDISACYIHDNDFSKATKLKELIIGNSTEGYSNVFLTHLVVGNNPLLEKLDIKNTPNLVESVDVSGCGNLQEFYADGSGITGVVFASGGKLRIAHIPAITSLTIKSLAYLEEMNIEGFNNLRTLIVENTPYIDTLDYVNSSPNLTNVRLIGIDWKTENTSTLDRMLTIAGIDNGGYNTLISVLTGSYYSPIVRQKLLADYNDAWSDLSISYDTLITQYSVVFQNDDGTILDIQYVDKGSKPVDPITRATNPIPTPTKESSVQYDFTFDGWDTEFTSVFGNQTITATYTSSLRKYTVKYVSKGTTLQTSTGDYGTYVFYEGDTPTYVAEESGYKYYFFERWDKSGYVDGDKIINAVYDTCEYTSGYYDGKDLSTMRPVEIYALTRIGIESSVVESMDSFTFTMGGDYDYDDIESHTLISEKTSFTGKNYVDTGISVMDIDRDFVLAVDYEFGEGNSTNATLMQCFQTDGSNGFKLLYNSYPRVQWGTSSNQCASGANREMLVLRHTAGENGLRVYTSNLSGSAIGYFELERTKSTTTNSTLVFGCVKADDGEYENYAIGTVYWAKLWFADLGESACRKLASYIHESITVQMCGFKRKYLSDGSSKRSSMSFLASHTLRTKKPINNAYSSEGGWAKCSLNTWLNTRFYEGLPLSIKQLIKQVKVSSSAGNQSDEITTSDCYIYIPALVEIYSSTNEEPYINEDTSIDYIINNADRVRKDYTGTAVEYWTRSPNYSYESYFYYVNTSGGTSGFGQPPSDYGVVIEFSI